MVKKMECFQRKTMIFDKRMQRDLSKVVATSNIDASCL